MKTNIYILFFFVLCNSIIPQVTETKGNLIGINFLSDSSNTKKVFCTWTDRNFNGGYELQVYEDIYIEGVAKYFVKKIVNENQFYPGTRKIIVKQSTGSEYVFSSFVGWVDLLEPYIFERTKLLKTQNGFWLLNGKLGVAFFSNADSLSFESEVNDSKLLHICGKVLNNYLIVTDDDSLYLADISDSPLIKPITKISSEENVYPQKIYNIIDSLYIIQTFDGIYLGKITNEKVSISACLIPNVNAYNYDWIYKWGKIFFTDEEKIGDKHVLCLFCAEIDLPNKQLVNRSKLINGIIPKYRFSVDGNYFTSLVGDTLVVYSIDEQQIVKSYDFSKIKYEASRGIIIDSPYVYVHAVDKVVNAKDERVLSEYNLSQNYPNPFNPITSIKYEIPKQSHVELKVYDILGREISTIVNEEQVAGKHEAKFNGENLSSGVYIYKLKARNYLEIKKMMLLK